METSLVKGLNPLFKTNYLRMIAAGHVERTALLFLEVEWLDFFELCAKDPVFRSQIDDARKNRADRWIDDIAESIQKQYFTTIEVEGIETKFERPPTKDEIAKDKLDFEKRKFLAQADNPEKYAQGGKVKVAVEFDMQDFKLLDIVEAQKVLSKDPFAIDAEFSEVKNG